MGHNMPDDIDLGGAGTSALLQGDLRAAFRAAAEGMALATLDGRLCMVNRALCEILGQAEAELLGQSLSDLLDADTAGLLRGRLAMLKAGTQRMFRRDCRFIHRRGHAVWLALSVALVRDGSPDGPFLVLQARDITEAKQVERMMLDSDRRFRTIFNALSEGFVETDTDGRVIDVNDPLCRMLGFGREELIGRSILRFIDGSSAPLVAEQLRGRETEGQRAYEVHLKTKGGGRVDVQVFATTLAGRDGTVTGATAILLDVTARNQAQLALQASEQRYRTLVDSIQDGLVLVRDGRYEYVNAPFAEMLDYTPGDLIGASFRKVVHPDDLERVIGNYAARLAGDSRHDEYEAAFIAGTGRKVLVHIHAAIARDEDGRPLTIATVKDVTQRRRIEAELRKLSSAVEHSPASVFITDVTGTIEYVNPKFTEVTGYAATEAVGRTPALLRSGETDPVVYRDMWKTLKAGLPWRGEFRNRRKDGSVYWEFTSISPIRSEFGDITHFVAVKEDTTQRKEIELLNWRRANFDQVTELPNRVLFKDRLSQAIARARRDHRRVAVMFIDLDRFKAVNDTLGHEAGDAVLREVATRLTACMRDTDTVARLGGDEFTAILPQPGGEKAVTTIATRILKSLRRPFIVDGNPEVYIGGSIGIAIFPNDGDDPTVLLKNADAAMYRAKEQGRNTYQFFTPDMNLAVEARVRMEHDLRRALEDRHFAVHFQPFVDAESRRIEGAEALVRWADPGRGLVPPGDFLPVAEEIGLIGEIGALVLNTACEQAQRWRDSGHPDFRVSVNISGRQLSAPDFIGVVRGALRDSGLPPHALELEVGENLLLSDVPLIASTLRTIADMGIKLTIDDFGTGYSSLQHLRRFPFTTLKVDRSFVRDVLEDREDAILVEAVIAMARKLGMRVVAEGVENEQQIDYLRTQYCHMFQGFLFGRPLPAEEFQHLLEA